MPISAADPNHPRTKFQSTRTHYSSHNQTSKQFTNQEEENGFQNHGSGILDAPIMTALQQLQQLADFPEENEKTSNAPTRTYVRDAKAMASTPADVKEYPNSYVFVIDMPGLKSGDIKVQVEDDNVLLISGERKREDEKEGVKYLRMERRVGKFMRKFVLPENANADAISAVCQDGVLTVTVEKVPPPQPKTKTIEVKIG